MPLPHTSGDPSKIDASESIIVRPESLRLGMYVDLNCSWFKHSFPRRSFKITSQSQITTIQGLGLATLLVYPRESDPETATNTPPPSFPSMPTTIQDQTLDKTSVDQGSPATDTEIPTHSDYHHAVELASEAYRQVLQRSSQMMKDLSTGSLEGLRSANVMIGLAGLLLDIGEQRLPRRILENRSQLSQLETVEYQHHPYYAVEMLRQYPGFPEEVLDIIRSHHERLDGSGYPEKLKGDEISLSARIVGAVEQYDARINNVDRKQAVSPAEALAWIYKHQNTCSRPMSSWP